MKVIHKPGDRVSFLNHDGIRYHGSVEKQTGTILYVKWDDINYRHVDVPHKIDYRDTEQSQEKKE